MKLFFEVILSVITSVAFTLSFCEFSHQRLIAEWCFFSGQTSWPFTSCPRQLPYFWLCSDSELGTLLCHKASSLLGSPGACVLCRSALYVILFMPCWISLLEKNTIPPHHWDDAPSSVASSSIDTLHQRERLGFLSLSLPFIIPFHGIDPQRVHSVRVYALSFCWIFLFFVCFLWDVGIQPWSGHKRKRKCIAFFKFEEAHNAGGGQSDFRLGSAVRFICFSLATFKVMWPLLKRVWPSRTPSGLFIFVPRAKRTSKEASDWRSPSSSQLYITCSDLLIFSGCSSSLICSGFGHVSRL